MVEGAGFEPAKPFRTPDLQSGGFNHSPTPPENRAYPYSHIHYWGRNPSRPEPVRPPERSRRLEPQRGFEPLTCRLQIDCASIAPQGHQRSPMKPSPGFREIDTRLVRGIGACCRGRKTARSLTLQNSPTVAGLFEQLAFQQANQNTSIIILIIGRQVKRPASRFPGTPLRSEATSDRFGLTGLGA